MLFIDYLTIAADSNLNFHLILAAIVVVFAGCVYGIAHLLPKVKLLAPAPPIGSWKYSAAEWKQYAEEYDYHKNPVGGAQVIITRLEIRITGGGKTIRKALNTTQRCVTDCRFLNHMLKLRVRYHYSGRNEHYNKWDFFLPVPRGSEQDAVRVVEFFKTYAAEHAAKIAYVMPDDALTGLFGETDF